VYVQHIIIKHNSMRLNTITLNMINYEAKRKLDTSVVDPVPDLHGSASF
jgi:hypothetical protein